MGGALSTDFEHLLPFPKTAVCIAAGQLLGHFKTHILFKEVHDKWQEIAEIM